jgi:geranylgeranyl diphosphate synthase type II
MFSGGKRTRPQLTLLAALACGGDLQAALPAACAIECLHCASLIWDDMPCMDNSSERRGVAAVHLMFGEGTATLAALSLLNHAYAIFGRYPGLSAEATHCVSEMIAGQVLDLKGGPRRDLRKSTGMMRLTFTAGALACGADAGDVSLLARCGEQVGAAYQIFDDFADGDVPSAEGAEDLITDTQALLQRHFTGNAAPLIAAVGQIARHFSGKSLAAA